MVKKHASKNAGPRVKLFLSYGRKDASELAHRLKEDLTQAGYDVWKDTCEINAGEKWDAKTVAALETSEILVAVLSPHAVRMTSAEEPDEVDGVCLDEISYARFAKPPTPVVPIMGVDCNPPFTIFRLSYVDMRAWQQSERAYQQGLRDLLKSMKAARRNEPRLRPEVSVLEPLDFDSHLHEKRHKFCGREWLFKRIEKWRRQEGQHALLLTGDPGAGKSAIVAELVHRCCDDQVLAYHCCHRALSDTHDAARFVQSIAAMIAGRRSDYAAKLKSGGLLSLLEKGACQADPDRALKRAVLDPLVPLLAEQNPPCYLLVDALDEALLSGDSTPSGMNVVDLLAQWIEQFPAGLRVLATTRKKQAVLRRFQGLSSEEIRVCSRPNQKDLQTYINKRLASDGLRHKRARNRISKEWILETLTEKSGGNFLYVQQALDAVERGNCRLDAVDQLPRGLCLLYGKVFTKRFRYPQDFAGPRVVLECILAAQEPLDSELLRQVTGLTRQRLNEVLEQLDDYLLSEVDGNGQLCYRIFHSSLAEWLENPRDAGPHHCDLAEGHSRLANKLWRVHSNRRIDLPAYGRCHLTWHLVESGDRERLSKLLTNRKFTANAEVAAGCVRALMALDDVERWGQMWAGQQQPCSRLLGELWRQSPQTCYQLFLDLATKAESVGRWGRASQLASWVFCWSVTAKRPQETLRSRIQLAQLESSRGNARAAWQQAHRAEKLAKQLANEADDGQLAEALRQRIRSINTLGRAAFDLGNSQLKYAKNQAEAKRLFGQVGRLAGRAERAGGDRAQLDRARARAATNLGVLARLTGRTEEALRQQKKAWELRSQGEPNPRDLAWSARDLGWLAWDRRQLTEAQDWFELALERAREACDPQAQVWIHRDLEQFASAALNRPSVARQHQLAAYERLADLSECSVFYDLAGSQPSRVGKPIPLTRITSSSRAWYEKAVNWFRRQQRKCRPADRGRWARGEATALNGLAWTWLHLDDQDANRAEKYFVRASELRRIYGTTEEMGEALEALVQLGFRAVSEVKVALARRVFRRVLSCVANSGGETAAGDLQRAAAGAHHGLGILQIWDAASLKAIEHFRKAEQLRRVVDLPRVPSALARLGSCLIEIGETNEARSVLEEACQLAEQWHDAEAETSAWRQRCRLELDRHLGPRRDLDRAQQYAERAAAAALRSPIVSAQSEAIGALAEAALATGQTRAARKHIAKRLALAHKANRHWGRIESLLAQALAEQFAGRVPSARKAIREASRWATHANVPLFSRNTTLVRDFLDACRAGRNQSTAYEQLRAAGFGWLPDWP
jgi:tetratricopeptide (TPR) repeat protein